MHSRYLPLKGKSDATRSWKMPAHIEKLASQMAILFNGGQWHSHYTEAQREVWRQRVIAILDRTTR